MKCARLMAAAGLLSAGWLFGSTAEAGERGGRDANQASFRITSPTAAEGFVSMKTGDGKTIFVSQDELFSAQDIAGFRTITGSGRESLELALPSNASDRLTNTVRSTKSSQLAIVRGKKLIGVAQVDLDAGSQPRLVGLPVGGADRITPRLIKRTPVVRSAANVSVVPRQASGRAGDLFTVDVFVSGASGISTFQFKLDAQGGTSGKLTRTNGTIDQTRADYLFSGKQAIVAVDEVNGRFGGTTMQGAVDATAPKYAGSYAFRASPDANGEFHIGVIVGPDSFVSTATVAEIPYRATGATISVTR